MSAQEKNCQDYGALELVDHFNHGRIALTDYVKAMQGFCESAEPQVKAFAQYMPEIVNLQVDRLEDCRQGGLPLPPMFGVPVGIKDNIDTEDYATECGYAGYAGRAPHGDAWLVHKLREAGAVVWGKTRTTELAYFEPTITENPRAPGHTPGGSSSGSAAAVAAGLVPVAVGTQTNGSVIRPASYCGVYGFKPSRGKVFNGGVLNCSQSLDQVGVFARSVEDLALVSETIMGGHHGASGALVFPTRMREVCLQEPPLTPRLMFAKTPLWDKVDPRSKAAFEALLAELTDCMVDHDVHDSVSNVLGWHKTVMEAEMQANLQPVLDRANHPGSAATQALMQRGKAISASDYLAAKGRMDSAASAFDEYFDYFDAIVTPATLGPAPEGLASTGDPAMCTIWTFAGLPCVSLPLLHTEDGLPIGIQLVGALNQDARLLRTARWLAHRLTN